MRQKVVWELSFRMSHQIAIVSHFNIACLRVSPLKLKLLRLCINLNLLQSYIYLHHKCENLKIVVYKRWLSQVYEMACILST